MPTCPEYLDASLWNHWAGHLVIDKYQMSEKWEYTAIRNAAGIFDGSPLYKYWIRGRHAERFLGAVLTRDFRTCRPGQAQRHLGMSGGDGDNCIGAFLRQHFVIGTGSSSHKREVARHR